MLAAIFNIFAIFNIDMCCPSMQLARLVLQSIVIYCNPWYPHL